jgi:hypothetical protein
MGLHGLLQEIAFIFYEMVFVPHKKHLRASTACYRDVFTALYADDFRTSQDTHIRSSTACYADSL